MQAGFGLTGKFWSFEHFGVTPDMVGFGFTERPAGVVYDMDTWVRHAVDLLDALDIEAAHIVGNSFGGGLALALAIRHPARVRRLVLMGSVGVPFVVESLQVQHAVDNQVRMVVG